MKLQRFLWTQAAIVLFCGISFLTSCTNDDDAIQPVDQLETTIQNMSLREKIGQMFYVRPEALDTTIHWTTNAELKKLSLQQVTDKMRGVNEKYPIGGIILYGHNIKDEPQLAQFIGQIRSLNGHPLLCIDEEGGLVARIANNGNFDVKKYESMGAIGATGDPQNAYECGNTIGTYLNHYNIDINFAPVADVNTNPENIVIGSRAFSDDPEVAATMVTSYLQGMRDAGIVGCIKHFPGHGDTTSDTHYGYAQSLKTWDEINNCEMIPFKAGIAWGCQLIMTAHISVPNVTGSDIPATMSSVVLQDKLRGELGYDNIICSDAMEMGAITQQYTCAEAVVGCIKAGVDIVLSPRYFVEGFEAVVAAVEKGEISEERINQSVRRILKMKRQTSAGI